MLLPWMEPPGRFVKGWGGGRSRRLGSQEWGVIQADGTGQGCLGTHRSGACQSTGPLDRVVG